VGPAHPPMINIESLEVTAECPERGGRSALSCTLVHFFLAKYIVWLAIGKIDLWEEGEGRHTEVKGPKIIHSAAFISTS